MNKILQVFIFINIFVLNFTSLILPQEINSPKNVKFLDNRSEKDKKTFDDNVVNSILSNLEKEYDGSSKNLNDSNLSDAVTPGYFNGAATGDQFGYSVSGAGDVNNDGFDDIIIGAPFNDAAGSNAGSAYIYFGASVINPVANLTLSGEAANDNFGISVSSAGDVNGDGYSDVIVGASGYSSGKGRAYIYFGGASMNNTDDVRLTGETAGDLFGNSVSSAGDVNGDGYSDVIAGAKAYSSAKGRAYIFFGGISMNNTADVILQGSASSDNFGISVSSAGDVNGDGFADVIAGAPGNNSGTGKSYIFFGGNSMDNAADVTMTGEAASNFFGCSVSSAGDVNGDGYSDVITGAYGYSTNKGRAYIFLGGAVMNNISDVTFTGEFSNNYFGYSVSKTGDINGDGFSDVIAGAYKSNSDTGKIYIYYGGAVMNNAADIILKGEASANNFGLSVGYAGDVNGDGFSDALIGGPGFNASSGKTFLYMYGMSGSLLPNLTMVGEGVFYYLGFCVASAGDVNGDGYSDILVGAYVYDQTFTGRVYLYLGGSNINNVADLIFDGESINNFFGYSLASAGDVNNDGYSDIIIGAYGYATNVGRAYIYYGGSNMNNVADVIMAGTGQNVNFGISVSSAGDVNNDGYADVIIGSNTITTNTGRAYIYYGGAPMNNLADVTLIGEATNNYFGVSVASAGDVNADGYADVIVGANGYSSNTGRAYIFYGAASMDPSADVTMTGEAANNYFGFSVSSCGDVNKDSYSDVVVGAYGNNSSKGKAYIYFGGAPMNNVYDISMTGETTNSLFGHSVASGGDINNDGYSDVLIGAEGFSSNTGKCYIYFGGASMNNTSDIAFSGEAANTFFGKSVAYAGDVNGDGYNDIIAGANNFSSARGKSYLYLTNTPLVRPNILSAKDVPNDHGGNIYLKFSGSAYDVSGNGLVTSYLIERSVPPGINGYQWVAAGNVTAVQSPVYNISVSTPVDSGTGGNNTYYFRVTAKTSVPSQQWVSNIMSGYSVDNIVSSGKIILSVIIEGYYDMVSNNMRLSDTASLYLRSQTPPYIVIDSSRAVINSNSLTGTFQINNATSGNFYLTIKQRNTIETWSRYPVNFIQFDTTYYSFITSASQAFGNNLHQVDSSPIRFAIYSGDVNQDGSVDLSDVSILDNAVYNFVTGYTITDLNGDGSVDITDLSYAENNATNYVSVQRP